MRPRCIYTEYCSEYRGRKIITNREVLQRIGRNEKVLSTMIREREMGYLGHITRGEVRTVETRNGGKNPWKTVTEQATELPDDQPSLMAGKIVGGNFQRGSIEGNDGNMDRQSRKVTAYRLQREAKNNLSLLACTAPKRSKRIHSLHTWITNLSLIHISEPTRPY